VASCCECGDEPLDSCVLELVSLLERFLEDLYPYCLFYNFLGT
jgi:hypothetical protein